MDNSLCPCSNLDWRDCDMTRLHHPDCQQQNPVATWTPASEASRELSAQPLAYWRLGDVLSSGVVDWTGDLPAYRINIKPAEEDAEDLNPAPWIYPAQAPEDSLPVTIEWTASKDAERYTFIEIHVAFIHCGVLTEGRFTTPHL